MSVPFSGYFMRILISFLTAAFLICLPTYGQNSANDQSPDKVVPETADLVAVPFSADFAYKAFNDAIGAQDKGSFAEAITNYRKVVKYYPCCYPAQYNLGLCLESLKKWDEALTAFEGAMTVDPYSESVYRHLVFVAKKAGQQKKVRLYYNDLLKL